MKKLFSFLLLILFIFAISNYASVGEGSSNVGTLNSLISHQIGEGISNVGNLTSIINHTVGVGISNVGTLSSTPTFRITLTQTDYFVPLNQNIPIQGSLIDPQGLPIANTYIAVHDALKGYSTIVQTDQNGNFTHDSFAKRIGVYQIYFDYSENNVSLANNNVLIDVGNEAVMAIFEKVKYYNSSAKSVTVSLKYEGLNSLINPQNVTYEKDFVIPPATTMTIIETDNFNYEPALLDKSSEQGPPPSSGPYSIGRTLCPVQFGLIAGGGPDPEEPNSQVFSGGLNIDVGIKFQIGFYYDKKDHDFGVSLNVGGGVPYLISGSGGLTVGTDGLGLNVAGIVGISKWTVKVFDSETNTGMNAITGVIHSPIDPLFIDPQGRRIGVDPATNTFVNEIPYASYTGPSSDPQIINIPNPLNGNWNLTTIGREEGPYTVEKNRYFYDIVDQQIINGTSIIDSIANFLIIIDTTQTTILPPDSINVSLADTSLFVNWSAVPNALYYKVYYDSDTSGIPYYGTEATQGNSPITVSGSEVLTLTGLDVGKIYYVSVTTVDPQGVQSYFSDEDSCLFDPTTRVDDVKPHLPTEYSLSQNYPNPFNPSSKIAYSIPSKTHVLLKIYDLLGRELITLVDKEQEQGAYSVIFNAKNLSSGIYLYQLKAGSYIQTRKMTLIK